MTCALLKKKTIEIHHTLELADFKLRLTRVDID